MALLSYIMDKGIAMCTNGNLKDLIYTAFLLEIIIFKNFLLARVWLYRDLTSQPYTQYVAWVTLPVSLILFSAGFVHLVAPQSIGK